MLFKHRLSLFLYSLLICAGGINASCPSGICCDPYLIDNLSINADLLYWKAWEKNLVLTNKTSPIFFTDNYTKAKVIHPTFDWDFGARVGMSTYLPCCWDVHLDWTYFHTRITQNRHTDSNDLTNVNNQQGMFPIWALSEDIIAGDYVSQAHLNWKLTLNLIDLEFGHPYRCHDCFEIRPYIGLRAAWVRQNASVNYQGGIFFLSILEGGVSLNGTDHITLKNNYWGLGPRAGFQPKIYLGKGFSFYGDAAIAGLCGTFHVKQRETYLGVNRFSHHNNQVRFRWVSDLAAGIGWDATFCGEYTLGLKLGWEYHVFFDQLELKRDHFHILSHNRNLDVQGLTFSTRFDY